MSIPFTAQEFFDVFVRYNTAVWPAPWFLGGLGLLAMALAAWNGSFASRVASAVLALFWLWMGVVYHLAFFATINPAARLFGTFFVVAAGVFCWIGAWRGRLAFRLRADAAGLVGGLLMAYALVGYPVVGYLAGQRYPAAPTFGAPCPTTIFTLGMLLWVRAPVPWTVVIVPALWSLVGASAAFKLGVPEDYGLLVAGIATVVLTARNNRARPHATARRPAERVSDALAGAR